jgi:hypothetical protein
MGSRRSNSVLSILLLAVMLSTGGCTGVQEPIPPNLHYFDKTEVDLEYGRPEPSARYHQPQGAQLYTSDGTQVDLATPRASQGEQQGDAVPLFTPPNTSPPTLLPGGR